MRRHRERRVYGDAKLNANFAFYGEYDAIVPTGNLLQQTISLGLSYRF